VGDFGKNCRFERPRYLILLDVAFKNWQILPRIKNPLGWAFESFKSLKFSVFPLPMRENGVLIEKVRNREGLVIAAKLSQSPLNLVRASVAGERLKTRRNDNIGDFYLYFKSLVPAGGLFYSVKSRGVICT